MADAGRILVVDDVPAFCEEVRGILAAAGADVVTCGQPLRALRLAARERFDLVITTLVMKELGGFELMRRLRGQGTTTPVLMITGYGNDETAIEATRLGVADYMEKPVAPEELRARVARLVAPPDRADALVAEDPATRALLDMVPAVARTDSRVLILGETGTGKELLAQAIHRASARRHQPFVEVNCAAIPESLLESELFGHERGAFTGATERRVGRFEEAARGTLFLDEIGEMSFNVQSKLLRVLQGGRFSRVGGQATLTSHARIIAATNRDLAAEAEAGRFRADLFYRLHVISLTLPPLRKRPLDIPLLAQHFLRRFRARRGRPLAFSAEALACLGRYDWPGNVRELEHLVERLSLLHEREVVTPADLPERVVRRALFASPRESAEEPTTYREARRRFEAGFLEGTLRRARGNMAEGARLAGLDRSQFFRMVRRHGLDPRAFR
jgi:DNA-binding NtrC family response regulator